MRKLLVACLMVSSLIVLDGCNKNLINDPVFQQDTIQAISIASRAGCHMLSADQQVTTRQVTLVLETLINSKDFTNVVDMFERVDPKYGIYYGMAWQIIHLYLDQFPAKIWDSMYIDALKATVSGCQQGLTI